MLLKPSRCIAPLLLCSLMVLPGCEAVGAAMGGGAAFGIGKALGLSNSEAAALAVVGAGVGFVAGAQIRQSNELEKQRAELEALKARQRLQDDELRKLKEKQVMLAVKVNDDGDVMVVDPETGEVVDEHVYRPNEEGLEKGYGDLGDHSVIFVGEE